ncbi:MAG: hypothetical protein Tp156SUR915002_9 [Prokaryotic dsDNA virus sp.]|nr:MAG: hypothetical protein Tp162SUR384061_18 [Prokaryotic dsDNA virus sp.]QDP59748.1 MAG: hypothetical protein Tp156SUR915002_9 [Prokaryotic dsDNA virus sp.]
MTDELRKLVANKQEIPHNEDLGNNYYPSGWKPQVSYDNKSKNANVTAVVRDKDTTFDTILRHNGFDPNEYEVVNDTVKYSTWQTQLKGGEVADLYAYKFEVRKINPHHDIYYKTLLKEIKAKKPLKKKTIKGNNAFLYLMADWQIGKKDYGTLNTIQLIKDSIEQSKKRIKTLNNTGVEIDEIYIIGLGDLIENCFGFFPQQAFNVELNRSEQAHLTRKMILEIVDSFLPLANRIYLGGVAGNHGENRTGKGEVVTSRLDNEDTNCIQIVGEIMSNNPRYKKVKTVVPDSFHLTLDIKGIRCGFTHGHLGSGSGDTWTKIEKLWKGQMFGWKPLGSCEILYSGHYHHFRSVQQAGRTWFQAPSLDASFEFEEKTGYSTDRGVLTMTISKSGWDNLKIL